MNNTKSGFLKIWLLLWGVAFYAFSFGQNLNPPRNLNYTVEDDNDTYLFWNPPANDSAWVHWDNGINDGTFDINNSEFYCAARWDTTNLKGFKGWKIKKVRFYLVNAAQSVQLKIWRGDNEWYSQQITGYNINDWTEITLDSVLTIDDSLEMKVGLYVKASDTTGVVGVDAGPAVENRGNLFYTGGQWQTQIAGNWNIQFLAEAPPQPVYLHWDGEHDNNYYGFFMDGYREYACAAKWNPEHLTEYNTWKITSVKFVLKQMYFMDLKLKIWEGPNRVEVYSQDIDSFNDQTWTELPLDTPFEIDATKDIFVGIYIKTTAAGQPIGMDTNQLVTGQGFWMYYKLNGNWIWYEGSDPMLGVDNNMNLRIKVEPVKNEITKKGLLGYNVYRNDDLLTVAPVSSTSYVDMNLNNGTYEYKVTAVYDDGESPPCDPVTVQINQPVILEQDSLALVDLYNQCGGENWYFNDLWLEGPVNEWDGVYTEGNRVIGVWLSLNGLTGAIPQSFGNLTALRVLHLEGNTGLNSLPQTFGNLDSLRVCWIGYTGITEIPATIGNLSHLEDLMMTNLDLSVSGLPETIGNLSELKSMGIANTGLTALPETFGNLDSLMFLYGDNNQLTSLPENFGELQNLRFLLLYDNELEYLPVNFGEMNRLRVLYLENNNLVNLPDNFGDLESLFYFSVSSNHLESLPDNFGSLNELSYLYLGGNELTQLPETFGNLSSLDTLVISNNQLTGLPDNFGDLDELNYCLLSYNQLTTLPESFTNLAALQDLMINVNNLTALPADFGNLTTLRNCEIAVNQIQNIPESVGNLVNLRYLNLNQNELVEVPASIGNLDSLRLLGLSVNHLHVLPESVGDLNLTALTINDNQLETLPASMFDNFYDYLYVQENKLQFGSLEPLIYNVTTEFKYIPQAKIGTDTTIIIETGNPLDFTIEVTGNYNNYQWYKDGVELAGFNSNTLHFDNVSVADEGVYILKVTNNDVVGLELISEDVVLTVTTGLHENDLPEFVLFPNPVNDGSLTVRLPETVKTARITVYTMTGKKIKTLETFDNITRIDVGDLPQGIFLLTVSTEDGKSVSRRFVKNY